MPLALLALLCATTGGKCVNCRDAVGGSTSIPFIIIDAHYCIKKVFVTRVVVAAEDVDRAAGAGGPVAADAAVRGRSAAAAASEAMPAEWASGTV